MSIPPDSPAPESQSLREQVAQVINAIRPAIQGDGGDLELVSVSEEGVVQVRFHGACVGCPSASMTLSQGVERILKEKVPQVTKVVLA
ncbi:MAG: NifU family protein [Phycisphaerales bacterium]|nr:MAG: NifU family protein [Phycisphaerales bacterium]